MGLLATESFALSRGDMVYTCHYRPGFMWTSAGRVYDACEYVILEKVGSRYRVELLDNSCQGNNRGDVRLVSGSSLFTSDAIKYSSWGNKCKASYIAK